MESEVFYFFNLLSGAACLSSISLTGLCLSPLLSMLKCFKIIFCANCLKRCYIWLKSTVSTTELVLLSKVAKLKWEHVEDTSTCKLKSIIFKIEKDRYFRMHACASQPIKDTCSSRPDTPFSARRSMVYNTGPVYNTFLSFDGGKYANTQYPRTIWANNVFCVFNMDISGCDAVLPIQLHSSYRGATRYSYCKSTFIYYILYY